MITQIRCPVCNSNSAPLDVVDFNKSCEELRQKYLPLSQKPIYYFLCENCHFCFAPEIYNWTISEFEEKIYNNQYIEIDPDYVENRPTANAKHLIHLFDNQ